MWIVALAPWLVLNCVVDVADAFQVAPGIGRIKKLQQPTRNVIITISATESDESSTEDVLDKFALPLEFKKIDTSTELSSSPSPSSSSDEVTQTDTTTNAASFTPSPDTPLANKYYLKLQEAKKGVASEGGTVSEVISSETTETSQTPRPGRYTDFGIASEQDLPINADKVSAQQSEIVVAPTTKLRGFTDLNIRPSRDIKVGIEGKENNAINSPSETKPLSSQNNGKTSADAADKADTTPPEDAKDTTETDITKSSDAVSSGEMEEKITDASSPHATSDIKEERTSPSLTTDSQPSSSELIKTQPISPLNQLTLPIKMEVETYGLLPLIIIGVSVSLALGVYMKQDDDGNNDKESGEEDSKNLLEKVKDAGTAGAISYALWEAAFWGISFVACLGTFKQVSGHWPDFSSSEDAKQLGLEVFAFVNVARLAVPLRIGLALATVPFVEENILRRFQSGEQSLSENDEYNEEVSESEQVEMTPSSDNIQSSLYGKVDQAEQVSTISNMENRLNRMETEASPITSKATENINVGIDPSLLTKQGNIEDYCEPGRVNNECSESVKDYLDSLASTGAVATDEEAKVIVKYLDSLSSNVTPIGSRGTRGTAFTNYLDALSTGYVAPPSSAAAVKTYLDVLNSESSEPDNNDTGEGNESMEQKARELEERLSRLESSIDGLPNDISSKLIAAMASQDKKIQDEMNKISALLVEGKTIDKDL